jgi:hypothetical protein
LALIFIAVAMIPFAATGRTNGIIYAAVVWVIIAIVLARRFRSRNEPRPPTGRSSGWLSCCLRVVANRFVFRLRPGLVLTAVALWFNAAVLAHEGYRH